jgi:hypothetical protein
MKSKLLFPLLAALAIFLVFANCSDPKTTPPGCTEEDGCEVGGGSSSSNGNPGGNIGAHATLASNKNLDRVREMYDSWINTYYVTFENDTQKGSSPVAGAEGTARIRATYNTFKEGAQTCSEAIGYGMILTSLMGDWERFDKLLAYSKLFSYPETKLMRWSIANGFSGAAQGPATDADIDILASLIIAYRKTNSKHYLDDAIEIGASLYEHAIGDTKLLLPAVSKDGIFNGTTSKAHFYNISYMSLAAIKALADYDKERNWNEILEANLSYMERVQNAGDGLWPDWSGADGVPINPCNGSNACLSETTPAGSPPPTSVGKCTGSTNKECSILNSYESYYKETPRIPWRIAWYYHWYGDPRAKAMLDKGMSFLQGKGISVNSDFEKSIKEFYSYQGNRQGLSYDDRIIFSLCALGMGSSANQEWLNKCNNRAINGDYTIHITTYYPTSLQLIYAMLFNGMF